MADRNRRRAVFLAGLAIVAIALLASGLSTMELAPGRPAASLREPAQADSEPARLRQGLLDLIVVALAVLSVVLAGLLVVYLFFSADPKKRLLITLGLLAAVLTLYLISQARPRPQETAQQAPAATAPISEPGAELAPAPAPPASEPNLRPPAWLVWLGAVTLSLLAAGVVAGIAWLFLSGRQREPTALDQLAREAERALDALAIGTDLDDTIMRCYFQMSEVLKQEQGIVRPEAMTPREFAREFAREFSRQFERGLWDSGPPREAVSELTRLFERVRYGGEPADEAQERKAVMCLSAIAQACRGAP